MHDDQRIWFVPDIYLSGVTIAVVGIPISVVEFVFNNLISAGLTKFYPLFTRNLN